MYVNSLIFVLRIFDKSFKILFVLPLHLRLKQALLAFAFSREDVVQLQDVHAKTLLLRHVQRGQLKLESFNQLSNNI